MGAEVVHGDLKDPQSLLAACDQASVVITTANAILSRRRGDSLEAVDRDGSLALIGAARSAGVQQFIYTSVSPLAPANNVFIQYKREVESALRASGLTWTILQPSAFMEIHAGPLTGWDLQQGRARIAGSGRSPVSYIATADVAAFAAAAVHNAGACNRALHLTGPEPLSPCDAVAIAERVTGRPFKVQRAPLAVLRAARIVLQPFNPIMGCLLAMAVGSAEGSERNDMAPPLLEFQVEPTTFEQYVRRAAGLASTPPKRTR